MNSFLLWIGGLMVAVLGLLFAAPLVIDWNSYRGVLEEEATRILGRDVRVGGRVDLRLLPSPYVRFEKVRISDSGAALGEPFFRAEAFTLWLSPTPLLRGAIEASELELDRPVLRLAVDAEGKGNWQALRISSGAMPFMPSDVVLQRVHIRNGIVSLKTTGAPDPLSLTGIDGEVSADSLSGPYRFRGTVDWYGSPREIRLATSQREPDGKLRYKASVRAPHNGNLYVLDGVLSELSPAGRHTGTLTAKIPLANVIPSSGRESRERRGNAAPSRGADLIDLTAAVQGDIDGVRLDDMAFSFEQDGKPQLLSGVSAANWRNGLRIETRLSSRWLDLDQISGQATTQGTPATQASPLHLVRNLIGQVSAVLPPDGSSLLTIDVDQVNLGGTPLSGVRLALARAGGLTSIGELKAALPGNARGELRGTLGAADPARPAEESAFDGEIILRGGSYQRFAAWAGASGMLGNDDAPFSLASKLNLQPTRVVLSNASIELAGRRANASLDWSWGKSRRLDITAEGRVIDVRSFAPGLLNPAPDVATPAADKARHTGFPLLARLGDRIDAVNRAVGDLKLRLRTAELSDGALSLRDIDADIAIETGRITITRLIGTSPAGGTFDIEGDVRGLSQKLDQNSDPKQDMRPEGSVRGWLTASSAEAISGFADLLPEDARSRSRGWLKNANRLDTSFGLSLGGKPDDRLVMTAVGAVDGVAHSLELKLDGGLAAWRKLPVSLALTLEGRSARPLIRNILLQDITASQPVARARTDLDRPARLQIDVAGAMAQSMVATARLDLGASATAGYQGRASVGDDGALELSGTLDLVASDVTDLASLLNAGRKPAVAKTAARGTIGVERKWGATSLSTRNLTLGDSQISGDLKLAQVTDRTRIDAKLTASRIDLPVLLGLVLDGEAPPSTAVAATDAGASPWPDSAFDLSVLDHVEGQIVLTSPLAHLTAELALEGVETRIGLTSGRVEIAALTGAALGGRVTARGAIERAAAGANMSLDFRITDAALDRVAGAVPAQTASAGASGTFNLSASSAARSLSPRAAVAAMNGKGELEIRNGRITGLGTSLAERVADQLLDKGDDITRDLVQSVVAAERARGVLPLGNRKLALEISEGIVRVAPLEIATEEAAFRNVTTVELATLKADSEWQLTSRRPWGPRQSQKRREPLPAISFVWTGSIATIGRLPPRMSLDALERDLSIRKLERDAERLEDLRRQDEERARTESARIEAERQRALDGAPTGAPGTPSPLSAPGGSAKPGAPPTIQAPFNIRSAPGAPQHDQTAAEPPKAPLPRVVRPPIRPTDRPDAR